MGNNILSKSIQDLKTLLLELCEEIKGSDQQKLILKQAALIELSYCSATNIIIEVISKIINYNNKLQCLEILMHITNVLMKDFKYLTDLNECPHGYQTCIATIYFAEEKFGFTVLKELKKFLMVKFNANTFHHEKGNYLLF